MTATEFQNQLMKLQKGLTRFAYSLTTDKDDAKDLVQETYFKALKHSDRFIYESNFNAWICTIMKNIFINNYRFGKRHNSYINQIIEGFYQDYSYAFSADDPYSAYATKEINNTIETLNNNYKLPFKMYHEGYKYKEIAELLDLKIGTVKSRIYFARKILKEQLNVYAE